MAGLYSKEQIAHANNVNLVDFLRSQGESLTKSGKDMRWNRHTSVTLRGNQWFEWKSQEGGYPIHFLQKYYHYSFREAMEVLLSVAGDMLVSEQEIQDTQKKEFQLPSKSTNMKRVFTYLHETRGIDKDILGEFIKMNLLYEDAKYHNAVFVGYDENGIPRHAHKKSTFSNGNKSYRGNIEGSDPRYTFHYVGKNSKLFVFEAPIDMLSYISLHKENWQENSYIALNGLSMQGIECMMENYSNLKIILLCLDHDIAGIEGAERIKDQLVEKGYHEVGILQSLNKDWNEDIKKRKGKAFIEAEDNPRYKEIEEQILSLKKKSHDYVSRHMDYEYLAKQFSKIYYTYKKSDFKSLCEKMDALLIMVLQHQHQYLNKEFSFSGHSDVWEMLQNDYRSYKDHNSLDKNIRNIMSSFKEIREELQQNSDQKIMMNRYRNLSINVFYARMNIQREMIEMKEMNEQMGLPEDKRPQAKMIGEDGNIFNLMGIASRSLKDAGYKQEATEMIERITTTAKSYDEALNIISQYVNPVGDDMEMDEDEIQLRGY